MINSSLITGNSSGLGLGLTMTLLRQGATVYGLSRRGCPLRSGKLHDRRCDLTDLNAIDSVLVDLLDGVTTLDIVILNAGVLGEVRDLSQTPQPDIEQMMTVNVWSNKVLIDFLIRKRVGIGQLVLISSGASISGHRGWGAYSLSKATLNMLGRLYAREMPGTHIISLAPGLVDTAMQDYLCDPQKTDVSRYPSLQNLRDARGTIGMPGPDEVAEKILKAVPQLPELFESGDYVDIRNLG